MKPHVKLYLNHFGYETECEVCTAPASDIHHIAPRGMGGTKRPDRIENLQALCRKHHEDYGDKKQWKSWLYRIHVQRLVVCGKPFDKEWIESQIERHENLPEVDLGLTKQDFEFAND